MLRRLHAIDAHRLQERMSWLVSFWILSCFGPRRCSAQAQEEEDPDQTGDPGQMDAKAHERHKEITLRNKKREMMEAFTVLTRRLFLGFSELQRCEDGVFMVIR